MYCPNCGSYMQEQASFCPTCGQAVLQAPTVRGKAECARELQLILPDLRALEENYKQIGIYSQASSNAGKDMKLVIRGLCFFAFLLIASLRHSGCSSAVSLLRRIPEEKHKAGESAL